MINIYLDIICLSLLAFSLILVLLPYRTNKFDPIYFLIELIFDFLVVLSNLIGLLLKGQTGDNIYIILRISNFCEFFFGILLFSVFAMYCSKRFHFRHTYLFSILCLPLVILLVTSQFNGCMYYIDEANIYHRSTFYIPYNIYFLCLFIALTIVLIVYRKRVTKREFILWLIYLITPPIFFGIQAFVYGIFFSQYISTLLLMVVVISGVQYNAKLYIERTKEIQKANDRIVLSQMQPHFIFNCLSAIMALDGMPKKGKDALGKFSKYLRNNLDTLSSESSIPFVKEIDNVNNYVDLENLRMDNKIKLIYKLDYVDFLIPSLSIEIVVENAIKHGLGKKGNKGTVTISSSLINDEVIVTVSDDGVGFDVKAISETGHYGIKNLNNRIGLVGGAVNIESKINKGTIVTITLPKK